MRTPTSFRFEMNEHVGLITLTRPDTLNSLTFEVYRELAEHLVALQQEPEVRAVVITGEGRGFCSGGDHQEIIAELLGRDAAALLDFTRLTCDLIRNLRRLRKPVIAAVNGAAAGAGAVIALAADLRVAADDAKLAFLFTKVGLAGADMGAAFLLPRVVGLSRATELLYLGDAIDAATAERYGLFNRVVPKAEVLPTALALAKRLAAGPTFALGVTKELLDTELDMALDAALDNEARAQALCMQTRDFREASEAFRGKRPPRFEGR
jgi:enoyl-CoA hydratase/carnithine racemase